MLDVQRLEHDIQGCIGSDSILGLGIAIVQGDNVLHRNGFGITSIKDGGLPVTPKTIFAIGSTRSRCFTPLDIGSNFVSHETMLLPHKAELSCSSSSFRVSQ